MNDAANKTIVFSFDGTGNEPIDATGFVEDESISNVLKLHLLMGGGIATGDARAANAATDVDQLMFYYNGIGTLEDRSIPLLGWLINRVNMAVAPHWGDAARILRAARDDLRAAYRTSDRVVVFGYSRGAALARKFVSLALREGECAAVEFLGVFDTVAAMDGIHRRGEQAVTDVVFENGTLHPQVRRAVHLVALDEDRVLFTPTLINRDAEVPDRILEMWFPGVHGDVGGGYWHDGLSDVALEFMIEQCRAALGEHIHIVDGRHGDALEKLLLARDGDELHGLDVDDLVIRPVVGGPLHAHSGALLAVGGRARRRVCVRENGQPTREQLPLLHPSVPQRFSRVPDYRPPALRGVSFALWGAPYRGVLKGIGGLAALAGR